MLRELRAPECEGACYFEKVTRYHEEVTFTNAASSMRYYLIFDGDRFAHYALLRE